MALSRSARAASASARAASACLRARSCDAALVLELAAGGGELRQHVGTGIGLQVEDPVLDRGLAGVGGGEHLEGILRGRAHEGVDDHLVTADDQLLDAELAFADRSIGVGQRRDGAGHGLLGLRDLRDVVGHRVPDLLEPARQRRRVVGGHEHLGADQRLLAGRILVLRRLLLDTARRRTRRRGQGQGTGGERGDGQAGGSAAPGLVTSVEHPFPRVGEQAHPQLGAAGGVDLTHNRNKVRLPMSSSGAAPW